ncbi:hypothetical protein ACX80Z_14805 [Arthrobacter sp. TMT4-20]
MAKDAPHPLYIVSFFFSAALFAAWDPFTWWRAIAAVYFLGLGCYAAFVFLRHRKQERRRLAESAARRAEFEERTMAPYGRDPEDQ